MFDDAAVMQHSATLTRFKEGPIFLTTAHDEVLVQVSCRGAAEAITSHFTLLARRLYLSDMA